MADDNKTEIQIVADSSKLKPGMAEAQSINKATADAMKMDWQSAGAVISGTVNNMSSQVKGAFSSVKETIGSIQGVFVTMTAVLAGGAVFNNMINKTVEWTSEVKNLRKTLGITAEEASVLNVALRHIGVSGDEYAEGAKKLARVLLTNEKAFGDLGVKVRNTDGTYKNSYEIMQQVVNGLGKLKEGTDRNVAAMEILKRSNIDINKLMLLNAEAMEAARQKAEALHLVVGPDGEKKIKKYKESINDLKLVSDSLAINIGSYVIPAMTQLGAAFLSLPITIKKVYDENQTLINSVLTGIAVWATFTIGVAAWATITTTATALAVGITTAIEYLRFAVWVCTGGFAALTAAEAFALGGWVIAAAAAVSVGVQGLGKTINDVADAAILAGRAMEALFFKAMAVADVVRMDWRAAAADWEKGMAITNNMYDGIGTDWTAKIKEGITNAFGGVGTPPPIPEIIVPGGNFDPADQAKGSGDQGPSPYDIAKAKYQADIDVLGMTNGKKLELYKADLENVTKTAAEATDYKKGLSRMQLDADKEAIETKLAFLDLELAKQNKNSEQGMEERVKIIKEETALVTKIYGDQSKEYAQAKAKEVQLERQAAEQKVKIQKEILDHKAELAQIDYDIEAENIKMQHELGKISDAEEIRQLNELENKKYEIKLKAAQDALLLMKLIGLEETQDYKKLYAQIELMQKQHNLRVTQQNNQFGAAMKKPWTDLKKTIQDSLASSLASVAKGTMSIKGLFQSMAQSVLGAVIDMWAKQAAAAIMGSQTQVAATAAAATAATATAATSTAANMTMLESIGTALSSIPWYGWVGLAILAGVASARGSGGSTSTTSTNLGRNPDTYYSTPTGMNIPSYDVGAWSINGDQFAKVHDEELIVPAKGGMADTVRGMLSGQMAPAQASGPKVNNYFNATAMDTRGIDRVFRNNARIVTQSLYKVSRTLSKPNPSRWGLTK